MYRKLSYLNEEIDDKKIIKVCDRYN